MNDTIKRIIPHAIAVVLMIVISTIFFSQYSMKGKVVKQFDNVQAKGMQAEIMKYHREHDETILWTNAAFGGNPVYQIHMTIPGNQIRKPFNLMLLGKSMSAPHAAAFIGMLGVYLLLLVLRVDWKLALGGGIAFGLCNYNMDLFIAGHSTKILTLAYLAPVMAGVILIFRKKYLLGAALYSLAFALQLFSNHLQITYYTGLLVGIFVLINIIFAFINEEDNILDVAKGVGILAVCSLLAVGTILPRIWTTSEYSAESQRGKSELKAKKGQSGLSKQYGMSYALKFKEALLPSFAPNYYGGGKEHNSIANTELYEKYGKALVQNIQKQGMSQEKAEVEAKKYLANFMYTGNDFTPGVSIYFGIIAWFMFVLGMVLAKGKEKWWLAASAFFMLGIALGDNFFLNEILFDNFPMFNKFRAMSMAMGLVQVAIIGLAFYGIQQVFNKDIDKKKKLNALYIAGGTTLGILLLMFVTGGTMTHAAKDSNLAQMFGGQGIMKTVLSDRKSLMRGDILRSVLFLVLAAGLVWAYLNHKVKGLVLAIGITALVTVDVWTVSKRIASNDKFEDKKEVAKGVEELPVDKQIKSTEKDIHYRVLDLSNRQQGPFQDARASYFHKSVGGYFSAKMMLFEEVKNRYLARNPMAYRNILGMLNTKWIIAPTQGGGLAPYRVQEAMGNAWFVKQIQYVNDADAELNSLEKLNAKNMALVQKKHQSGYLSGFNLQYDSTATIALTNYHPDRMEYTYSASKEQFALFSEMYYPPAKGWTVYLNGEKIEPFIKADYMLRAMRLPVGQNMKLEMKFEPASYYKGKIISQITSVLLLLLFVGGVFLYFKKNGIEDPNLATNLPEPSPKAEKVAPTQPKVEAKDKNKTKKTPKKK